MTNSHETRLRKLLNLRPDDRPQDLPKDKPWPPPIPEELAEMVTDAEQMTRNQRGGGGASVEMEASALISLVVIWRFVTRRKVGVCEPPKTDTVTAPDSLAALRKKVQEKTGRKWEEVQQANRAKLEEWLNG